MRGNREETEDGARGAPDPEERDLLRRIQQGERQEWARLIDRYGEGLMRYLQSILHDREQAEETFQDTWVAVTRKIGKFDLDRSFGPWLFRVARNQAYDRLRRRRRWSLFRLSGREEDEDRGSKELPAPPAHSEERLVAEDLAAKLLPRLEARFRELIWLYYFKECSYQEMAEICDLPLGTVKNRMWRAVRRLGELYEEMERDG